MAGTTLFSQGARPSGSGHAPELPMRALLSYGFLRAPLALLELPLFVLLPAFYGREAGLSLALVGLVLLDRGVLRAHQRVITPLGEGEITSGSFSPTLEKSIALARLPKGIAPGDLVEVDIRGKALRARVVKPPFVRHGKALIDTE